MPCSFKTKRKQYNCAEKKTKSVCSSKPGGSGGAGSCWNNPQARELIPCIVEEFGCPSYDINVPGGVVYWENPGIFCSLYIEDILANHDVPCEHCDSLSGSFLVYIKPEYLGQLFSIDRSFGYLALQFSMVVMCHNARWVTGISYVVLRYLDSLDFPEKTKPFSIEEARSLIASILNAINYDTKLYCVLQRKINKYVCRNQEKYCDVIFRKCELGDN